MEPEPRDRSGQPEFDAVLEKGIEDGLRHVLGESGLQLVLSLSPLKHISTDPMLFHKILRDVFMESGAVVIEREVAKALLANIESETGADGRSLRSWLATPKSKGREFAQVSKKEKEVLLKFLAPESIPRGGTENAKFELKQIDLTAARFAHAFKKGS